jgi:hypothetical protein
LNVDDFDIPVFKNLNTCWLIFLWETTDPTIKTEDFSRGLQLLFSAITVLSELLT